MRCSVPANMPAQDTDAPAETHPPGGPASFNRRLGLILFGAYLALYALFVYLTCFHHGLMAEQHLAAGVNLAVIFGFGLIAAAVALAVAYMAACRAEGDAGKDGAA